MDGVLTLDMPPEEGEAFRAAFAGAGIDTIFLLSPTTTVERIRRAAALGSGFLYGISRLGVTGVRDSVAESARELADAGPGRNATAAGARVRLLAARARARDRPVRRRRGRRQRAGQRDRRTRTVAGAAGRSRAVRAMAAELSLEALRDEIDKIDEVIVRLLDSRARCAYAIGRVKHELGPADLRAGARGGGDRARAGGERSAGRPARRRCDRAALRTHHGRSAADPAHRSGTGRDDEAASERPERHEANNESKS